jgi:Carboxypeptidase regulatory-like domain
MRISAGDLTRNFLAISAAAAFAVCGVIAHAQSGAGTIQGTVTDPSGAVIPGAAIHVLNQATGVAVDTRSNAVGFYQVPDLFTGNYVVTITSPGMKTYNQSIELLVAQTAVIDAALTAGAVSQQVTVEAQAVQLTDTENGIVSSTLENQRISQLPLNGRNLLQLTAETTPGLEGCAEDSYGACPNGLQGYAMNYVADGAPLSADEFGGEHVGQTQFPDLDSIQEVRIETSGLSAQYASPATGIITTKSGTNQLHGSVFWTQRNSYWGTAKQRQSATVSFFNGTSVVSSVVAPLNRVEAGGSVGGPIVLPHVYHGKDKSFFFFAYERYSLAQIAGANDDVFPAAWSQGNFNGITNSSGTPQTLYDPNTTYNSGAANCPGTPTSTTNPNGANPYCRESFTQEFNETGANVNTIPINRLSPTAQEVFAITPPATNTNNPLLSNTYNLNGVSPTELRAPDYTFRLDHEFNENNRSYLRFTMTPVTQYVLRNQPYSEPATIAAKVNGISFPAGASGYTHYQYAQFATALGYTHVFSPTFYAETIASQQWYQEQNNAGGTPNADFESEMGLPNNFGEAGFPVIGNNSSTAASNTVFAPNGTQFVYGMTTIASAIDENLVKTINKHQLMFGGRLRHERIGSRTDEAQDNIQFNGDATGLYNPASNPTNSPVSNTGQLNADFFLGGASQYGVNQEPPYGHFHTWEFDAYLQDDYHVARSLTLNMGVRYEAHPAIWVKYGLINGFDLKNDAMVLGAPVSTLMSEGYTTQAAITNDETPDGAKFETAAQAGLPAGLINNDNVVVEPRFGFAWQALHKWGTVIRSGYGIYAFQAPLRSAYKSLMGNNPFQLGYSQSFVTAAQSGCSTPLNSDLLLFPQSTASGVNYATCGSTPVMGVNSTGAVNTGTTTSIVPGFTNYSVDPDFPVDLATQFNFTIEQPFKWNSALRVSYNWVHGTNLDQEWEYNNHPSTFVWEVLNGAATPTGGASTIGTNQYSATATGPYDQTTWGGNVREQKSGWSNDNQLQVVYQKIYHSGMAWQAQYVWQKNLRVGGNSNRDGSIYPYLDYGNAGQSTFVPVANSSAPIAPNLPPPPPAGSASYGYYRALNKFENYAEDVDNGLNSTAPPQHLQFNYIYDLPFGRGKRLFGGANKLVNEIVGGYQLAGDGQLLNQNIAINSENWGPAASGGPAGNSIHVYKHKYPITDCTSGTCYHEYLWWNGYISPLQNANNACAPQSGTKVVSNLPSSYVAYQTPMDVSCTAASKDANFGTNQVIMTFANGKTSQVTYQPGPNATTGGGDPGGWSNVNPFSKTIIPGPFNFNMDASLYKVFPVTERVNVRFNMDVFNLLNNQGSVNPSGSTGEQNLTTTSFWTARQVQFSLRLSF